MDYKERLLTELIELARKREILKRSLEVEECVDKRHQDLLREQFEVMTHYEEILHARVLDIMK